MTLLLKYDFLLKMFVLWESIDLDLKRIIYCKIFVRWYVQWLTVSFNLVWKLSLKKKKQVWIMQQNNNFSRISYKEI